MWGAKDYPDEMANGFTLVAPGEYSVVLESIQEQVPKSGKGRMAVMDFMILDSGPAEGAIIKTWECFENESEKAQNIARARIASFARAVGLSDWAYSGPESLAKLAKRGCRVLVAYGTGRDGGKTNEIKKFIKPGSAEQATQTNDSGVAPYDG